MSNHGISGINIGQTKLDDYEGNTEEANLNARGSFSGRKARKIGSYLTGSHDLQIQQDQAQKVLNKKRINVLKDDGNADKAAREVSTSAVNTNKEGKLEVARCPALEKSLMEFEKLAKNPMANGKVGNQGWSEKAIGQDEKKVVPEGTGSTRNIVDPEKFKQRIQKDLTVFLGNTIKSTNTPHGLERLRLIVENQFSSGQISEPQKKHLNKLLGKQFERQMKGFPGYLAGLKPDNDSDSAKHELAHKKLSAIHEMTIAAKSFDPAIVKKHKNMLKTQGMACYENCGKYTPSKCDDLYQVSKCLTRLRGEGNKLLEPVIKLTSKNPRHRMEQADQSVVTKIASLNQQLKEIPALEHSMSKVAKNAVELMRSVSKLESKTEKDRDQLGRVSQELKKMKSGTGLLGALKPSYQKRRHNKKNTEKALRKSISANDKRQSNLQEQFRGLGQDYKKQFDAKNALLQKYGKSVEVLPEAYAPSSLSSIWKTEVSKLDENTLATEFDRACINHFLDSFADKFPREYFENEESLGVECVQKVAKEYVRAVESNEPPFAALKSAFKEGRILSM